MKFRYPCVRIQQDQSAKDLLVFSAPALEIDSWVGIPQRLELGGNETAGFQRTVSRSREAALRQFFGDDRNVIQNPILAAIRQAPGVQVTYEACAEDGNLGYVTITFEQLTEAPMVQLLGLARAYLESRAPELKNRPVPNELIATLSGQLPKDLLESQDGNLPDSNLPGLDIDDDDTGDDGERAEEAIFDESQITDFWDHLRAREEIAKKLPPDKISEGLLGFDRLTIEAYLRPVILVDGQHRLRGAVLATEEKVDSSEKAKELVIEGLSTTEIRWRLGRELGRSLPVSLLMDDSPSEHVFQYVVVNQKATPVPKALLGTIISTSLVADELDKIATRLEDARVDLEGARIISILSKAEDSPFAGKVAKGMEGESDKLPWSVLGSLADIFRFLEGAKFYHDPSADQAKIWRGLHLEDSPIVADWQAKGYESALAYWSDLNGPWLEFFKEFWKCTRGKLASEDMSAHNAWGNARDSNIFNKPSLHILATDFFAFLKEQRTKLQSHQQISNLVDAWLEYVAPNYFARDWKLSGVKKDSVGTRRQWSKLWAGHRQIGGSAPAPLEFAKLFKG
ncbi:MULTISPECIES: ParB N-terminal domain-containing protein [pseudomallei group]|nr:MULTISPECIES: hypothetical protein [pseudomallei group]NOK47382.1 hypothetical protein [Burkholderia thailandensis]